MHVLRVCAKADVLCLIQPLLSENDSFREYFVPFQPMENDTLYFGFAGNSNH